MYVPASLWPTIRGRMLHEIAQIKVGQPDDFDSFMCAVIDKTSFAKISSYLSAARAAPDAKILCGGRADAARGFFVEPTLIETTSADFVTLREEIFGPVLTVITYPDAAVPEALAKCAATSPYALTGAVFARDRTAIQQAAVALRDAAGNFYINDKSTGAMVGEQPFGGARASGTNDKAGSYLNLLRWTSPRSIKESFVPITTWRYPHMG
eukprot:Amastigsp_a518766_6.p2 type:complete len:210 gc:universal Amastigsp_a518766_6:633-4(-)